MLHKAAVAAIALFWAGMMGLLIQGEIGGGSRGFHRVPPEHVMRLIHRQGQESRLGIFRGQDRIGNLSLRPEGEAGPEAYAFGCFGGLDLSRAGDGRDRVVWSGSATLGPDGSMREFDLKIRLREPAFQLEMKGGERSGEVAYTLTSGDRTLLSGRLPVGGKQLPELPWEQMGVKLPPAGIVGDPGAAPRLAAWRCRIAVRGETIDAYKIRLDQGETLLAEVTVSQIGQVLSATGAFGYGLEADDLLLEKQGHEKERKKERRKKEG